MSDFNLRAVVRDALTGTNEPDPGVIAAQVLSRIDPGDRDAALSQAMRLFVRQVISETRVGHRPANVASLNARRSGHSAKVAAIREGWQRRLRDRVHTGDSEWKLLGDCNYDDLMAAAGERQQLADRNSAWAREYRAMAHEVKVAEVARFADLPVETQARMLGGAA